MIVKKGDNAKKIETNVQYISTQKQSVYTSRIIIAKITLHNDILYCSQNVFNEEIRKKFYNNEIVHPDLHTGVVCSDEMIFRMTSPPCS